MGGVNLINFQGIVNTMYSLDGRLMLWVIFQSFETESYITTENYCPIEIIVIWK